MKKKDLLINFLIGGCVGKTLIEISGIVANLVTRKNILESISQLKSLIIIFIVGGIGYNIALLSVKKIENKDMKSKERQQLLKKQMYITASAIILFSIFLIIHSIKGNTIGVIMALSFCAVFTLWGYSFLLSYINLKNSMAMINKKNI